MKPRVSSAATTEALIRQEKRKQWLLVGSGRIFVKLVGKQHWGVIAEKATHLAGAVTWISGSSSSTRRELRLLGGFDGPKTKKNIGGHEVLPKEG
jgi:hypothetical protein